MKKYFTLYRPFLLFLTKFFLTYIILTLVYQKFLESFDNNKVDFVTQLVADNTKQLMNLFDADVAIEKDKSESYIRLFYNQQYVARIIEGCNAISVIILFASFVVSFSGRLKYTLSFIVLGSLSVYVLNVVRIAVLSALLYFFPSQNSIIHGVVFPLFIYGVVFVLWIIWIRKFSLYAKNTAET
ncbi:exosortase family protein XrtF [Flavobacterium sp. W1B]|uniref:exosortase family protein XrtF n=1 Tax=Flavobacterium sp. W1B TaxID=3394146 RepID=UPI0039BCB36F